MKLLFTLIFSIGEFSYSADYRLSNLGDPFKVFVEQNRNESFEKQWLAWTEFKTRHSDLIPAPGCTNCEERLKENVKDFFKLLPNIESQMWDLFSRADEITKTQITRFKNILPDLPPDIAIAFVPSMFGFNGQVRNQTFFIGVDFVALRNDDLNVLFSHEFFHIYHGIVLSRLGKTFFQTMASPLWFEGMATWMSIELNPGTSDAIALMDETLALGKFCQVKENVSDAAVKFLKIIDYTKETEGAEATHSDWFKLSGKTEPKRRGYCLGLNVLRTLGRDYRVQDLVTLGEEEFSPLIKKTLATY